MGMVCVLGATLQIEARVKARLRRSLNVFQGSNPVIV